MAKVGQFVTIPTGSYCNITLDSGEKIIVNHEPGVRGGSAGARLTVDRLKLMGFSSEVVVRIDLDTAKGKAALATEGNVREIEHQKRVVADRVTRELKTLGVEKSRLESLLIEVTANVGEEGKLFGSVTVVQIAELIAAKGIELDRRKIQLDEPIKEVGEHIVPVRLHKSVVANLKVRVSAAE